MNVIQDKDKPQDVSIDFMLKEYDRITALRLNEITHTEQRFNYFLTITTTTIGAMIFLSQISGIAPEIYYTGMQGLLVLLLLFGFVNQNRQNMRTIYLNFYDKQLEEIQNYFSNLDPKIASYTAKQRGLSKVGQPNNKIVREIVRKLRGTLTDLVVLCNGLLFSGIVSLTLLKYNASSQQTIIAMVISLIISVMILYRYNDFIRKFLWF